jgi:hypothetical protein
MHVGQKHRAIARSRQRTNSKRRPYRLAVDDHSTRVPRIATRYVVETVHLARRTVRIEPQQSCIVGSDKDDVADSDATREFAFARYNLRPFAAGRSLVERMPADDSEHSSASIGCQTANRSIRELLTNRLSGNTE